VLLLAAAAVWLHWPAIHAGLAADDYLQRGMLDGDYPVARSPLDLYSFLRRHGELRTLIEGGIAPWWSHPNLRLSLLRPLASALLFLDHRVLNLSPVGQHVHSFLWLGAFVAAFHALAKKLVGPAAAVFATAVMAFDSALVAPVSWLCNRTSLVSATFGALALFFYLRYREDEWRPGASLSLLAFTLALAGGEYAFCALAYVAAFELFAARDSLGRRARGLLLAAVPGIVYLAIHFSLGYGADGSVVYIGPFDSPREFLSGLLLKIPSLIGTELLLIPGEWIYAALLSRSPRAYGALVPVAIWLALLVSLYRRSDPKTRGHLSTAAFGALFGLLPLAGTIPSVRLILIPSIGGSTLLGALIWEGIQRLRSAGERRRLATWLVALGTLPFAVLHLGFAAKHTREHSIAWTAIVGAIRNRHLTAEIDDSQVAHQNLVLLNASGDIGSLIYPPWVRHQRGAPMPKSWLALSIAIRPEHALRVSDDTLELSVRDGTMFEDPTSQLFRAPSLPFHVGDSVHLPDVDITVVEVKGWAPTRIRYRFSTSLDDPNRVFLMMEAGRLRRALMPPVGSSFELPAFG